MLWETSFSEENDAMPQTVPRSGRSPPAARPSDERAVPHSPPSLRRLLRLLGAASPPADPPAVSHVNLDVHKPQLQQQDDANFLDQFYNFGYQSPLYSTPSPSSDEGSIPSISVQPCSPFDQAAAYNTTDILGTHLNPIKEEPCSFLLSPSYSSSPYPLSPSESCVSYLSDPSPQYYQPISPSQYPQRSVEEEYIDIENLLKENQMLQETLGVSLDHHNIQENYLCNSDILLTPKLEKDDKPKDHLLLREVLEDTSFQKRLNLKPVSFDNLSAEFGNPQNVYVKMEEGETSEEMLAQRSTALTSDKMDQVLTLAIEQTRKDVENTCTMLGISPDPVQWSSEDVKAWLLFQLRQYSLPLVPVEYFSMDGAKLAALTEEEFTQRAPQAGSTLHAQLEIWKAARHEGWPAPAPPAAAAEPPAEPSDDEESESSGPSKAPTGKGGGAHIHLWQFLKELLAAPQLHAAAIRWLDRENGVFKIEDSVRVARLWGKRKNRPAMNYDKLSRSIRQYYKKGIMKKTERSQRLVYQFCHPYCL